MLTDGTQDTGDVEMLAYDAKVQVRCCRCGLPIDPNPTNTCINCIKSTTSVGEGIPKQIIICKFAEN